MQNQRIAVTRGEDGVDGLAELLRARGADVLELPLVRLLPPSDRVPLERAAARLSTYDWVVFTSANAVRALKEVLPVEEPARPPRRVAVVGSATARAVREQLGWEVAAMPQHFAGDSVAAAMSAVAELKGMSVLWPRAAGAREELARQLREAGARLDAPEAYRTVLLPDPAAELARRVQTGEVDVITFTAPSAIRSYAATGVGTGAACVAVIGPTTAAAARAAGLTVHVQPEEPTFPALVEAVIAYVSRRRG